MAFRVTPTARPVADAIEQLHKLLRETYGGDYSFMILGRGRIVAASNQQYGNLPPERLPDLSASHPPEQKEE